MFACPLFREYRELSKTAKLKGVNVDTAQTLISKVRCIGIVWFEFAKVKDAKLILYVKSPNFTAAKLKDFTVHTRDHLQTCRQLLVHHCK